MQQQRRFRIPHNGVSLLELIAVVTLMGVLGTAILTRLSRDILGDSGARSEARKLSLGMLEAQRAAIRTGNSHGVAFNGTTANATSWSIIQVDSLGTETLVEGPNSLPTDLAVSVSQARIMFDFEGNGSTAFDARLAGPHRVWQLRVAPLTQMIDSREITP